jgi:hypothetical protein
MAVFVSASDESDGGTIEACFGTVAGLRRKRISLTTLPQHGKNACLMQSLRFRSCT